MIFHKFTQIAAVLLGLAIPFTGMAQEKVAPTKPETTKMKDIRIVMKTGKGNIELTLFPAQAPVTHPEL